MSISSVRAGGFLELVSGNMSAFKVLILSASVSLSDEMLFFAGIFCPFFNVGVRFHFSEDHPVQFGDVNGILVEVLNSVSFGLFSVFLPYLSSSLDNAVRNHL